MNLAAYVDSQNRRNIGRIQFMKAEIVSSYSSYSNVVGSRTELHGWYPAIDSHKKYFTELMNDKLIIDKQFEKSVMENNEENPKIILFASETPKPVLQNMNVAAYVNARQKNDDTRMNIMIKPESAVAGHYGKLMAQK